MLCVRLLALEEIIVWLRVDLALGNQEERS